MYIMYVISVTATAQHLRYQIQLCVVFGFYLRCAVEFFVFTKLEDVRSHSLMFRLFIFKNLDISSVYVN